MKILIVLFTLISFVFSSNPNIRELRKEFYNHVIVINNYKHYFKDELNKNCKDNDIQCYQNVIKDIKALKNDDRNKQVTDDLRSHKQATFITNEYFKEAKKTVFKKLTGKKFSDFEYISLVDLSRQIYIIFLYDKKENKLYKIGVDLISGGTIHRENEVKYGEDHYFGTPEGVYEVKKGWRSAGKFKEDNVTMPYGSKDMFIYYFGKMKAKRYHTFTKSRKKIQNEKNYILIDDTLNFAIHSHNSADRLGFPNSHGCVRMSDEMNIYLDKNLVLHKNFFNKNEQWNLKYSKKPKEIHNIKIKGAYLVIVNSL
jgi:hypothetical protein